MKWNAKRNLTVRITSKRGRFAIWIFATIFAAQLGCTLNMRDTNVRYIYGCKFFRLLESRDSLCVFIVTSFHKINFQSICSLLFATQWLKIRPKIIYVRLFGCWLLRFVRKRNCLWRHLRSFLFTRLKFLFSKTTDYWVIPVAYTE